MDKNKIEAIRLKTRRRLLFTGITLVLYFSYVVLNYTSLGNFLHQPIGDSLITGSLVLFASLILIFIALEVLFLFLNSRSDSI
ncbi:MAG: uncharacterized membrane protein (DUF485 family) [Halieaceae bacterium]